MSCLFVFFFKQKTAYEVRISDWSSDVCSSDLLVGKDKFVGQASSEIEAINALVGTGFAGKKVMTSTSGPGVSLMGEGIGLSWMAEIPVVIVDVQRGGPATGLPTKTEQSDLLMAINPGPGDLSVPVIAPGTQNGRAAWRDRV